MIKMDVQYILKIKYIKTYNNFTYNDCNNNNINI